MPEEPVQPSVTPLERGKFVRGLIGALLGAALGYWLYYVCLRRGIIVLPLPGASIGVCRDLATRRRSWVLGAICAALALGVQGYIVQTSLVNGLAGMHAIFWAAFLAGIVFAFWFGIGRISRADGNPKE